MFVIGAAEPTESISSDVWSLTPPRGQSRQRLGWLCVRLRGGGWTPYSLRYYNYTHMIWINLDEILPLQKLTSNILPIFKFTLETISSRSAVRDIFKKDSKHMLIIITQAQGFKISNIPYGQSSAKLPVTWSLGHTRSHTWTQGHLVTRSLGNSVTWSLNCLVNWSFGHTVTWSLGHLVTLPLGHSVTW